MSTDSIQRFEWAKVELLGRRQYLGRCSEVQRVGITLLRVEVPYPVKRVKESGEEEFALVMEYSAAALYCYTILEEERVREGLVAATVAVWGAIRAQPQLEEGISTADSKPHEHEPAPPSW